MAQLIRMMIGEEGTVLIEVADGAGTRELRSAEGIITTVNKAFDKFIQNEIVENCRVLAGAFEQLKQQTPGPGKATAEFGLQISAEGNVYIAKTAGLASFKVSFEWQL